MSDKPQKPTTWTHSGREIRVQVTTSATPDEVYAAWADPAQIARWFVDRAEGVAKVGGRVTWHFGDFAPGYTVMEAEPGKRLVLDASVPGQFVHVLEVTIEPLSGGQTRVHVVNSGFGEGAEWDEQIEGIDSGWIMALGAMRLSLERYRGRGRVGGRIVQTAPTPCPASEWMKRFTTAAGLASWLTTPDGAQEIGAPGSPVKLRLRGGATLSGVVAARSSREVLLSWDEIEGALGLKAWSKGPGLQNVALDVLAWPGVLDSRRADLTRSLAALVAG